MLGSNPGTSSEGCDVVELKEDVEEGIRRMPRRPTVALKMVKSNGAPDPCHYVNPVAVLK